MSQPIRTAGALALGAPVKGVLGMIVALMVARRRMSSVRPAESRPMRPAPSWTMRRRYSATTAKMAPS